MEHERPLLAVERHRPFSMFEAGWEMIARHPSERTSLLRAVPWQVWCAPLAIVVYIYVGSIQTAPVFASWGMSDLAARLFACAMMTIAALSLVAVALSTFSAAYSRMRPSNTVLVVAVLPAAVYVTAVFDTYFGLSVAASAAIALAAGAAAIARVRHALTKVPSPVRVPIWLDDAAHAADLVEECENELIDPSLTGPERAAIEANLASGLAVLAVDSDRGDALPRAYAILAHSLNDMEPLDAYLGSVRLVEAMAAKEGRTGDTDGYEEALALMLDSAGVFAHLLLGVMARAMLIRATHLEALSRRVRRDGQAGRAARLHREALEDLGGALERSSPRRAIHALAELKLAALVDPSSGDLDAAIALCRRARRRLRLRSHTERDFGRLVLCDLLGARAVRDPTRAERDLAEAVRLCRRPLRHDASRADAARRLPALLRLRHADVAAIGHAYRRAFAELSRMSGSAASDIADEWSAWAIASADAIESGDAHWSWIRAVADDARRRPLRAEKERRLAQVLDLAPRTAERLLACGRPRDAAVALDLGRAMLLTERMHRDHDEIAEGLIAAGRADLAERWELARERIGTAERAGFAPRPAAAGTMLVGGRRFQQQFTTTDHLALVERERLLRDVARVPGCEDVDAPPDYDDLRAATAEGPIVYVFVTAMGGRAVIVTAAADPVVVSMPVTTVDLEIRLRLLRAAIESAAAGDLTDALSEILPWLWEALVAPFADRLAAGSLVTLIPVGRLSLLPLHVAGLAPDDDGGWRDRTANLVFRYAPNARVLGRAQAQAQAVAGATLRVLTVNVPQAPGEPPLPHARQESDGVLACFGAARAERPDPPTRAAVLSAMDRCGVWHFACHGIHRPQEPLESSLALADGRLKLRTIFARPAGDRRLAVLSACRMATAGEVLLDEVVSFPSALLQAGVAGVLSTQFDVPDRAAMLLVLRFFAELAHDDSPPRALARAQSWLSSATNAEIYAELASLHPAPARYSAPQLAYWMAQRPFADPHWWAPFAYCGA